MGLINEHLAEEELESYALRTLPPDATIVAEQHLLTCEECREAVLETESYMFAMEGAARDLRHQQAAVPPSRWRLPWFVPVFAGAVVLAMLLFGLPMLQRGAAPRFAVILQTTRGTENQATAPARRPLLLQLDLTGLTPSPSYQAEIVDGYGARVWQGPVSSSGSVATPERRPGVYFVRVALPSGQTLREYELQVNDAR